MKIINYTKAVIITSSILVFFCSIDRSNAEPGIKLQNQIIQSGRVTKTYIINRLNYGNKKRFKSEKGPVNPAKMIAMDLSFFNKLKSFRLKDKKTFRGLKLQIRKDIDHKISNLHVGKDIDYKILRTR